MSYSFHKAWSTGGSLKRSTAFGDRPKSLSRHLPTTGNKIYPDSMSYYGGSRLRRTLDKPLGSGSAESCSGCNVKGFESHQGLKNGGLFSVNSKETMMFLNDRLATYLERVSSLEEENQRLERKIKEWYEKNAPQQLPDYGKYLKIIEELHKKIFDARKENAQVLLHIDNARLAGEDLQCKYNMELSLHHAIEADVVDLRRGLDGLTLERSDLEYDLEHLEEDLALLNKNHSAEVKNLKEQLGARVHVEVKAAPAVDLEKALSNIRNEYESLMERNLHEVEKWFASQSEELNSQMVTRAVQLETVRSEAIDLRHTVQNLEIELQAQLSTVSALEGTLAESEKMYSYKLAEIQDLINSIESELAQKRYDLEWQIHEYKILTDVKNRLEMEIATYKRLMEGEDIHVSKIQATGSKGLKIVAITEDIQDGKVISKYEQVQHLKL